MAWRSGGTNNDEMVDNLKRFGVIAASTVEWGFRSVDRKFFVPKSQEDLAHADQPLKEGNVHISAPHIYGSALEALEIPRDSSMSFLNIGSGTGYVSSIVAAIMGPKSSNSGVEIHQDVVQHSRLAVASWKSSLKDPSRIPPIELIHGNALNIDCTCGEACRGFDRIYIGASVDRTDLSKLTCLLKPGGILVGPVEDDLVKVIRIGKSDDVNLREDDFSQQVISGVRFAPLLSIRGYKVVIPAKAWEPATHRLFPDAFRTACKEILLCCYADYVQPPPPTVLPTCGVNLAAMLPKVIWMEIFSFTHRDWFEPPQTEVQFLRRRLLEEQECSRKAQEARSEAETRVHIAERERDVFRLLARRWQTRLQSMINQQHIERMDVGADSDEDDTSGIHIVLSDAEQAVALGLRAMHRGAQSDSSDDDEQEAMDEEMQHNQSFNEEESEEDRNYQSDEEEQDEQLSGDSDNTQSDVNEGQNQSISPASVRAVTLRPQARTVSISSDDFTSIYF